MLRVEALRERLAKLEEVVARLGEVAAVTRDDFTRDFRRQWPRRARAQSSRRRPSSTSATTFSPASSVRARPSTKVS